MNLSSNIRKRTYEEALNLITSAKPVEESSLLQDNNLEGAKIGEQANSRSTVSIPSENTSVREKLRGIVTAQCSLS